MVTGRIVVLAAALAACGGEPGVDVDNPLEDPGDGPPAGNPNGTCPIPAEAGPGLQSI